MKPAESTLQLPPLALQVRQLLLNTEPSHPVLLSQQQGERWNCERDGHRGTMWTEQTVYKKERVREHTSVHDKLRRTHKRVDYYIYVVKLRLCAVLKSHCWITQ